MFGSEQSRYVYLEDMQRLTFRNGSLWCASNMMGHGDKSDEPIRGCPNALSMLTKNEETRIEYLSSLEPEEDGTGNVEYKFQILPSSADRFDRLVTQLNWRLTEGNGLCMYEVGVLDDGTLAGIPREDMRKSLANLCAMAQVLDAKPEICRLMMIRTGEDDGPTVHILSDDDEARVHLGIEAGLPDAEVVGVQIPRDTPLIRLAPPLHRDVFRLRPYQQGENDQGRFMSDPTTITPLNIPTDARIEQRRSKVNQRRVLRLERFEAAIERGAGKEISVQSLSNCRGGMPSREVAGCLYMAEVVIRLQNDFYIDYTLL